jgi:hypothetical protein
MYGSQKVVSPFEGAFVDGIENVAAVLQIGFPKDSMIGYREETKYG